MAYQSFCKIDVEGLEESILRGLTISISYLSFEFTREFLDETQKCLNPLSFLGKIKFNCTIRGTSKLASPIWLKPTELYSFLDKIEDKSIWGNIYAKFS